MANLIIPSEYNESGGGTQRLRLSELLNYTPKQLEARNAIKTSKFVFFGGAMGGGKSYAIRWLNIDLLIQWYMRYGLKNIRTMIAAETYPALRERQLVKVEAEFPPWLGRLYKDDKEFKLRDEYGGGVIAFRNLEDTQSYSSAEFAMISVDEITLSPYNVFLDLKQRLRWPGVDDTKFFCTGNPVGVGLGWVKKLWIDRIFDDNVNENPDNFAFVQSFASDNPYLAKDYVDMLDTLPEDRKQALKYGNWNIFQGQFFTTFAESIHKCDPPQLPMQVIRWRSVDWGSNAPASVHWWAYYKGKLWTYRELYVTGHTAASLAKLIVANSPPDETVACTVGDPSMFNRSGSDGRRISDVMAAGGVPIIPGNNDRIAGWDRMKIWLKPYDEVDTATGRLTRTAHWQISSACPNLLRTLPMMVYDKNKPEDLDTKGEDHAVDESRYLMQFLQLPDQMRETMIVRDEEEAFQIQEGIVYKPKREDEQTEERSAGY